MGCLFRIMRGSASALHTLRRFTEDIGDILKFLIVGHSKWFIGALRASAEDIHDIKKSMIETKKVVGATMDLTLHAENSAEFETRETRPFPMFSCSRHVFPRKIIKQIVLRRLHGSSIRLEDPLPRPGRRPRVVFSGIQPTGIPHVRLPICHAPFSPSSHRTLVRELLWRARKLG